MSFMQGASGRSPSAVIPCVVATRLASLDKIVGVYRLSALLLEQGDFVVEPLTQVWNFRACVLAIKSHQPLTYSH